MSQRSDVSGPTQIRGFVDPAVCQRWVTQVLDDEAHWRCCFELSCSYGHAWYLDIEAGLMHVYYAGATASNRLMAALPGYLPALVGSSRLLVGPHGETSLPTRARRENLGPYWCDAGIHLFRDARGGEVHADFEGLAPYPELMFQRATRAYTVTLCLMKPDHGGNLRVWPSRRYLGNEAPALEQEPYVDVEYEVGAITIFDSFCYHQILPSTFTTQPYRITGVVHFLFRSEPYPHWEHWY